MGSLEKNSETIAFTWSPNPKKFLGIDPKYQLMDTIMFISDLHHCSNNFIIYPELNSNGRIHYHGKIQISDKYKWFKKILPTFKYNGFVLIKTDIDQKWDEYISKDKDLMEKILKFKLPFQFNKQVDGTWMKSNFLSEIVKHRKKKDKLNVQSYLPKIDIPSELSEFECHCPDDCPVHNVIQYFIDLESEPELPERNN